MKSSPFKNKPTKQNITLSVIVPFVNEEEALPYFLAELKKIAKDVTRQIGEGSCLEIVFVDDGSRDYSIDVILDDTDRPYHIRLVRLSRNFRKENALAAGLAHATGDAVVLMDVDLQDPPELIELMVKEWIKGALIVNARRSDRSSDSLLQRVTSAIFYKVFNAMSDFPIDPNVGDFRLMDRKVVDTLNGLNESIRFTKGIVPWIGFDPVTLDYVRPKRVAGRSKWSYWRLWNFALDGLTGVSTLPIRIWTYFGGLMAFLSIFYAAFIFTRTLVFGADVPGYASLMIVVLIVGACNLMALGVIGEYLGRIAVEVRDRPSYIVAELVDIESDS